MLDSSGILQDSELTFLGLSGFSLGGSPPSLLLRVLRLWGAVKVPVARTRGGMRGKRRRGVSGNITIVQMLLVFKVLVAVCK